MRVRVYEHSLCARAQFTKAYHRHAHPPPFLSCIWERRREEKSSARTMRCGHSLLFHKGKQSKLITASTLRSLYPLSFTHLSGGFTHIYARRRRQTQLRVRALVSRCLLAGRSYVEFSREMGVLPEDFFAGGTRAK